MINGILNNEYTTDKCSDCPYRDECAKSNKYRKLYEPVSPAFIEEKRIFQSPQGKELYKLRPIYRERNFANMKSHQEFTKSRRIRIDKVDIDLKLEAIVINIKKNNTTPKCNLNIKKSIKSNIIFFFLLQSVRQK